MCACLKMFRSIMVIKVLCESCVAYMILQSFLVLLCRPITRTRGYSREILVANIANIESREWRRKFNVKEGIPPEHPRASTTDDVECFLRDTFGKDFTLKEVQCTFF